LKQNKLIFKREDHTFSNDNFKEIIFTTSKKVKDEMIQNRRITNNAEIKKIKSVLNKLPNSREKNLVDINLSTNVKKWVTSLLKDYPDKVSNDNLESLLNDFTDNMRKRMKEEKKYAVAILLKNKLILCHSIFGEETITPNWKTIPRMLDSDNILRFVLFENSQNNIYVKYFEKYPSESFINWLGLSQKDTFYYFGGKYRIISEINGVDVVFELNEKTIDVLLKEHPEIEKGFIEYTSPIQFLNIKEIYAWKKKYKNFADFYQDLIAVIYDINFYKNKFRELIDPIQSRRKPRYLKNAGPIDLYTHKFIDEKDRVIKVVDNRFMTVIEKNNPDVILLFTHKFIEIRDSFLEYIFRKFVNNEELNILHVGDNFSSTPLTINNLNILNKLTQSAGFSKILSYYKNINLQDRILEKIIQFIIFELLAKSNKKSFIFYFLKEFSKKILQKIPKIGKLTKLEDKIIEFKSPDTFHGKNNDIIDYYIKDLTKKLKNTDLKIYLIGIEDDGTLNPLPASRLKSDRINSIKENLQEILKKSILLVPIVNNGVGILILTVF